MKPDDELKDLSPRLHDLKRQSGGFQIPPGYFESMEASVFQQLDALGARRRPSQSVPSREPWWKLLWRPRLQLAFGLLALLVAAVWCWPRQPAAEATSEAVAAAALSPEDAEAYLLENALEVEADLLAAHLPEEETAAAEPATAPSRQKAPLPELEISPEELEPLLDDMSEEELEDLL